MIRILFLESHSFLVELGFVWFEEELFPFIPNANQCCYHYCQQITAAATMVVGMVMAMATGNW